MKKKTKIIKAYDIIIDGVQFAISPAGDRFILWRSKVAVKRRLAEVWMNTKTQDIKVVPVEIHIKQ